MYKHILCPLRGGAGLLCTQGLPEARVQAPQAPLTLWHPKAGLGARSTSPTSGTPPSLAEQVHAERGHQKGRGLGFILGSFFTIWGVG